MNSSVLDYEPQSRKRKPAWVLVVVIAYLLLLAAIFSLPIWPLFTEAGEPGMVRDILFATIFALLLAMAGASLVFVPVQIHRQRPTSKRSIVFVILGSSLALLGLIAGVYLCAIDYFDGPHWNRTGQVIIWSICIGGVMVWIAWIVLFLIASKSLDPASLSSRLYKLILLGSAAELIVAISTHIVVRRRTECCAGIASALGICLGSAVMLIALGPAVWFLYHRRWKDKYAGKDQTVR